MRWIWRAMRAVLGVALLTLCGCSRDGAAIRAWTLETPDGAHTPIEMPTHVNDALPRAACRYTLRATVPLSPDLRGRPLVLAVPRLAAHATLRANGRDAPSLEPVEDGGYRTKGPQRWAIDTASTAGESVELAIEVQHTWTQSAWLDTPPVLTTSHDGGARFAFMRVFNDVAVVLALGFASMAAYLYLVVFLADRRRAAYGWFALTGLTGALYPLFETGMVQRLLGPFEVSMAASGVTTAVIANVHFTRAYFELPPPARAWRIAWLVAMVVSLVPGYFLSTELGGTAAVALATPSIAAQALLLGRLARLKPRPANLFMILGPWAFLVIVGPTDFMAWLGWGELLGGFRPACLGIFAIGLLQATTLSRVHMVALRESDQLAAERADRIRELEGRNREVQVLNDELRRQVGARSRQLADALSRLGSPTERPLVPGEVVDGRYEVIRTIGAGAGGTVYLVERLSDRVQLAMKIVRGSEPQALARLAREAQLAAQTKHDNIISIVDVDVADSGFLYLVMEFVTGATLRESKEMYGRLPWATSVLGQIAAGLAAIHARGIVHRDLKPANVLLVPRGEGQPPLVKIADFGIARNNHGAASMPPSSATASEGSTTRRLNGIPKVPEDLRLTMTGMLLGTPLYMAPESIEGARDATAAVDMFAFGVIAFELLTAREPFAASPALAQLDGIAVAPAPPMAQERPDVRADIARLVDLCLSFEPGDRPSASDAAEVLSGVRPHFASNA